MSYVAIGLLFLLIVAAFVTFLVLNATKRSSPATSRDETASDDSHGGRPGIGTDHTPLGDTAEHAGEQDREGRTVTRSDADPDEGGGTGAPISGQESVRGGTPTGPAEGRFKRDPVGGEAESEPAVSADRPHRGR